MSFLETRIRVQSLNPCHAELTSLRHIILQALVFSCQ